MVQIVDLHDFQLGIIRPIFLGLINVDLEIIAFFVGVCTAMFGVGFLGLLPVVGRITFVFFMKLGLG